MLSEAIGGLLPSAVAVALSPIPIVAVVLVLGTSKARTDGPAFAVGWVAGLVVVSAIVLLVAGDASDPDSATSTGVDWLQVGLGALFLVLAAREWRRRPRGGETPAMPRWMASVEDLSPAKALAVGAALSGANPKNLALTLSAAASIAQAGLSGGDAALAVGVFVVVGSVTVVGSVVAYLVSPHRAEAPLASLKAFMSAHNAVIMMVVLLLLGAKLVGEGFGALGS